MENTIDSSNTDSTFPTIESMIQLKYKEIIHFKTEQIIPYVKLFAKSYHRTYFEIFGTTTTLDEQREVLLYLVVELHTFHTKPVLNEHTSDIIIKAWDHVHACFEYFMFYYSHK